MHLISATHLLWLSESISNQLPGGVVWDLKCVSFWSSVVTNRTQSTDVRLGGNENIYLKC